MNIAASRHHTRVQCLNAQQAFEVPAMVEEAPQDTYLRLFGNLHSLPVTPSQSVKSGSSAFFYCFRSCIILLSGATRFDRTGS